MKTFDNVVKEEYDFLLSKRVSKSVLDKGLEVVQKLREYEGNRKIMFVSAVWVAAKMQKEFLHQSDLFKLTGFSHHAIRKYYRILRDLETGGNSNGIKIENHCIY
jgi:hypothetical protein